MNHYVQLGGGDISPDSAPSAPDQGVVLPDHLRFLLLRDAYAPLEMPGASESESAAASVRIEAAVAPWVIAHGVDATDIVLRLFCPHTYDGEGELAVDAPLLDRLEHFLSRGAARGYAPGPLFDGPYYAHRAGIEDLQPARWLGHFLDHGRHAGLSPTPLFDNAAYCQAWADVRVAGQNGFEHFLRRGIVEGRELTGGGVHPQALLATDAMARLHNWYLFRDTLAGIPSTLPEAVSTSTELAIARTSRALISALFDPLAYRAAAQLDADIGDDALFGHYFTQGIVCDLAPGPLFDPAAARRICDIPQGVPAMVGWLQKRRPRMEAPTVFFNESFYRATNADLTEADADLFEHYVLHGIVENRQPNLLFDVLWYNAAHVRTENEAEIPAYRHYLSVGTARGLTPSQMLLPTYERDPARAGYGLADFALLNAAVDRWSRHFRPDQIVAMIAFFHPQHYTGEGRIAADAGNLAKLVDFLDYGLARGASPGPMFEAAVYAARCAATGEDLGKDTFLDYLEHGWSRRIVPNEIFDEQAYVSFNQDLNVSWIWSFEHFVRHGIYEGRRIKGLRKMSLAPDGLDLAATQLTNWQIFWLAAEVPGTHASGLPPMIAMQQHRVSKFTASPLFAEIVSRARAIDPSLGDTFNVEGPYAAPWHDAAYPLLGKLHARIPSRSYGTVIMVPWLRMGGSDLVACQVASAVRRCRPDERVLILRTDRPNFERPDWVPEDVDIAHISDILDKLSPQVAEHLIYVLLLSLEPQRVINVNSARAWRVFERFGRRLALRVKLYAYLFCWDQTEEGLRVGYPSMFYGPCAAQLTGIFTDTDYLRDELLRIYRPPPAIAARTRALYTPSRTERMATAFAEISVVQRRARRPRILWAGRLDRQKRFDLVQKIAEALPEIDFLCWGDAVLDKGPDHSLSPKNLILRPGFKSYDEVPFGEADLWLFTSAWEGMPTLLIEVAVRGMAVVASQVGGVPELVNDRTGYPVHAVEEVTAYVAAIQDAMANPVNRIIRARRLQDRVAMRYGEAQYTAALAEIFDQENDDAGRDRGHQRPS